MAICILVAAVFVQPFHRPCRVLHGRRRGRDDDDDDDDDDTAADDDDDDDVYDSDAAALIAGKPRRVVCVTRRRGAEIKIKSGETNLMTSLSLPAAEKTMSDGPRR